jgi:hypothetical protein
MQCCDPTKAHRLNLESTQGRNEEKIEMNQPDLQNQINTYTLGPGLAQG